MALSSMGENVPERVDIEAMVRDVQKETAEFGAMLWVGVNAHDPNRHEIIRRLNAKFALLKQKTDLLSAEVRSRNSFRADGPIGTARLYLWKYQSLISRNILLDGNLIFLAGQWGKPKNRGIEG